MPTATDEVPIVELGLHCNRDIGHHDTRTSRTCDRLATSAVYDLDAPRFRPKARCDQHEGELDADRRGQVLKTIPRTWADSIESAPPLV